MQITVIKNKSRIRGPDKADTGCIAVILMLTCEKMRYNIVVAVVVIHSKRVNHFKEQKLCKKPGKILKLGYYYNSLNK